MNKLDVLLNWDTSEKLADLAVPEFPASDTLARPPRTFRAARDVHSARLSDSPLRGIKNPGTGTAVQKAGKRYERKVLQHVDRMFASESGVRRWPSPWIAFLSSAGERHCQPDLLLELESSVLLCEIKLAHTLDAYWQLEWLYRPVVEKLFRKPVRRVEITRSFDPVIRFPEPMRLFFSLEQILRTPAAPVIEVLQWKL